MASRRFVQFRCRTLKSWSRPRQVIAKAESLVKVDNPRFVVTNLPKQHVGSIHNVYKKLYCARGDMENRIKEQQLYLFADRTSCSQMRANQLRLCLSSFAYVLMQALRWLGLKGTPFTNAQCSTLQVKLLKIAARADVSVRQVWFSWSENYPWQRQFSGVAANLIKVQVRAPPA